MMHKYLVVAGLALVGTASLAAAQMPGESSVNTSTSTPTPAAPPSPEVMKALTQQITKSRGAAASANGVLPSMTGGTHIVSSSPLAVTLGWHYFHAYNCSWYTDGTNNFFFVWPSEGGYWYTVNNLYTEGALATSCVHGYWNAVYVVNATSGAYNETYSYNFQ